MYRYNTYVYTNIRKLSIIHPLVHAWHTGTVNTILQGIQDAQRDSLQEMVEVLTMRIQQQMKEIMDKEAQNTEDILTAIRTMMAQIQTQTQLIHCKRW